MTSLPLYQVDAFADRPFAGNPAAVCPLQRWLPDATMQAIAAENNLSETAFFVAEGDGYRLRWFTPVSEVDLCGHATLATAHVVMTEITPGRDRIDFHTRSGVLHVGRTGDRYVLHLPARPPHRIEPQPEVLAALGIGGKPFEIVAARDLVVVLEDAAVVRALNPDLGAVARLEAFAVAVTAPGNGPDADVDFVSRFFAPREGIPEDPVTGSLHCTLVPYWAARSGKTTLRARQVSRRGGELWCELGDGHVRIGGHAVLVMRGELLLPVP